MDTTTKNQDDATRIAEVIFDDPDVLRDREAMQQRFLAEQAAETVQKDRRERAVALLGALEAGTATGKQVQAVLAYLLRREE